jgi:hypothetical protein
MDNWLAKQVIAKGWTKVIVMIDMVAFLKCGEPFQEAWLNAVMIPNDMELPATHTNSGSKGSDGRKYRFTTILPFQTLHTDHEAYDSTEYRQM